MDGPGIESWWGQDFPHTSRPALEHTTIGTESFQGVKLPGRGVGHPTSSNAEVKQSVELQIYCPSELCGLLYGDLHLYYYS